MQLIGSKEKFAFAIGPASGAVRTVQVWAGGRNLTPIDTSAYLPSFVCAIERDEKLLHEEKKIIAHESNFRGLTVDKAFELLVSQDPPNACGELSVLGWGETMDDVHCFLVPVQGKIHLAWMEFPSRSIHFFQIIPNELAETLRRAVDILKASNDPDA
jgi:hypothetical protein